ncbi:hypothetical protein Bca52824_065766 [Brassica carinata]|uniref:RRM domain-containing protein n=1 Tax=Brassica carinata TaxID=52824 RepID=A0A8X7QJ50_BRACI|nr:hypothetical protein Bca52824_065766 [Brassica carinata]
MIPGDPKQLEIPSDFLRGSNLLSSYVGGDSSSEDKGSSLQAMHKYGKVKSFRLVKHIGKGFAIALLEGASRGYAFVEYEPEKELCRAYEEMDLVVGKNLDNFVLEDEKDLFVLPLLSFF